MTFVFLGLLVGNVLFALQPITGDLRFLAIAGTLAGGFGALVSAGVL